MKKFLAILSLLVLMLLGVQTASAQTCAITGPSYRLNFDSVDWTMRIGGGQSCLAGFRVSNVLLDSVRLVVPPETGLVTLQGPGFTYKARPGFQGEDSFTVLISGISNRIRGSSTVRVVISVVNADAPSPVPAPPRPIKGRSAGLAIVPEKPGVECSVAISSGDGANISVGALGMGLAVGRSVNFVDKYSIECGCDPVFAFPDTPEASRASDPPPGPFLRARGAPPVPVPVA